MNRDIERAIEWDCAQVLTEFYACLDEKRYDDLVRLFHPEGAWVRLGVELKGHEAIRAAMRERDSWITAHVLTNVRVRVRDHDNADTTQFVTLYRTEDWDGARGPAPVVPPIGVLRHKDHLVRMGETWRFMRKTSRAVMANRERVTHYDKK